MKTNKIKIYSLKWVFFLFCCVFFKNAYSHNYKYYLAVQNPAQKIIIAEQLALDYISTDLDSLRVLGQDFLNYASEINHKNSIHFAYFLIGKYFIRSSNETKGIELLNEVKSYYMSQENFNRVTEIYNEIGIAYQYLGDYTKAMNFYEQSLKYGKLATDEHTTNIALINQAQAFLELKKYDEAIKMAKKYRDWALKLGSLKSIANAYAVLGEIELNSDHSSQAILYFNEEFKFAQKTNNNLAKGHAYTNVAIANYLLGDLDASEVYFQKALEYRKQVKNISQVCDAFLNYGEILLIQQKYQEALNCYTEGLAIATKHNRFSSQLEFLVAKSNLYRQLEENEKINQLSKEIEKVQRKEQTDENNKKEFNAKIEKELLRDIAESKLKESKKTSLDWSFYTGTIVLFVGFIILIFRKR